MLSIIVVAHAIDSTVKKGSGDDEDCSIDGSNDLTERLHLLHCTALDGYLSKSASSLSLLSIASTVTLVKDGLEHDGLYALRLLQSLSMDLGSDVMRCICEALILLYCSALLVVIR